MKERDYQFLLLNGFFLLFLVLLLLLRLLLVLLLLEEGRDVLLIGVLITHSSFYALFEASVDPYLLTNND